GSPDGIVISVEDEGQGIPEDELEHAFEPFYRVEESRCRETGGTGLGLAIVRQVARSHGGDAKLSNRPGCGVRAEICLPR
ncbi:MAG: ATP-binding protein, partial [Pseudomonadota bacterium]